MQEGRRARFEILEELASDELSGCWRVRDRDLQRDAVLHRLRGGALEGDTRRRILREARALAGVQSPHVLGVLEVGEDEEGPFLLLEPVRGESLRERLTRFGPQEQDVVRSLGADLCDALAAVHRAGLVHGNLVLEHVYVDPVVGVRLSGFLLARRATEHGVAGTTIGQRETLLGAAQQEVGPYAPEEARGGQADARSDLFALARLMVEALTGLSPYPTASGEDVDVALLRRARPDVDPRLAAALERALSPDPDERPGSAADLRLELQPGADSVAEVPAGTPRKRRTPRAALATVLGVAVLAVAWWGTQASRSEPRADSRGRPLRDTGALDGRSYADGYGDSYAIVVGVDRYSDPAWPPLEHAEDDARAIRDFLVEEERFRAENVTLLLGDEATRDNITRLLWSFDGDTVPVDEDDRVLFFFAGHGQQKRVHVGRRQRLGYLVPYDGTKNASTWILHEAILKATQTTPAKHFLLLLDCCFSGDALVTRGAAASAGYRSATTELVRQVITAGRPGEQVGDALHSDPGHSPFTHFLLRGLRGEADPGGRGFVRASQLGIFVREGVLEATSGRQTPSFGTIEGLGDFVFLTCEGPEEAR